MDENRDQLAPVDRIAAAEPNAGHRNEPGNHPSRRIARKVELLALWAFPGSTIRRSASGDVSIFRNRGTHTTFEIWRPNLSVDDCCKAYPAIRRRGLGRRFASIALQIKGTLGPRANEAVVVVGLDFVWQGIGLEAGQLFRALDRLRIENPLAED